MNQATNTWTTIALQRFFKRKGRIYIRHCSVHVSCRLPRLPGVWFAIAKIWCAIFTRLDSTCNFSGLSRISSSVLWKASQHHHVPLMVSHWRSLTWCYLLSRAIKLDLCLHLWSMWLLVLNPIYGLARPCVLIFVFNILRKIYTAFNWRCSVSQ